MTEYFKIWTIFDHSNNNPPFYLARLFLIEKGNGSPIRTNEVIHNSSLELLRTSLPIGLCRLPRDPSDDPSIIESWC